MSPSLEGIAALAAEIGTQITALEFLLRAIFYVIGLFLVVRSLVQAARRSSQGPQSGSWASPIAGFVTGAAFLSFPTTLSVLVASVFGAPEIASPQSIFSYDQGTLDSLDGTVAVPVISVIVALIQLIGFIAVARGLLMLNRAAASEPGAFLGPGLTFVSAGVLAANFPIFFGAVADLLIG